MSRLRMDGIHRDSSPLNPPKDAVEFLAVHLERKTLKADIGISEGVGAQSVRPRSSIDRDSPWR